MAVVKLGGAFYIFSKQRSYQMCCLLISDKVSIKQKYVINIETYLNALCIVLVLWN